MQDTLSGKQVLREDELTTLANNNAANLQDTKHIIQLSVFLSLGLAAHVGGYKS